jgi:hypothetical protein
MENKKSSGIKSARTAKVTLAVLAALVALPLTGCAGLAPILAQPPIIDPVDGTILPVDGPLEIPTKEPTCMYPGLLP